MVESVLIMVTLFIVVALSVLGIILCRVTKYLLMVSEVYAKCEPSQSNNNNEILI